MEGIKGIGVVLYMMLIYIKSGKLIANVGKVEM